MLLIKIYSSFQTEFSIFFQDKLFSFLLKTLVKGGHLDFSHLTELKHVYITEIYMEKKKTQYKSPRIKNHEIQKTTFF